MVSCIVIQGGGTKKPPAKNEAPVHRNPIINKPRSEYNLFCLSRSLLGFILSRSEKETIIQELFLSREQRLNFIEI
ncbi:hypothetical protein ES703_113557 [subsurface metagenome]